MISLFVGHHTGEDALSFWKKLGLPAFVVLGLPAFEIVEMVEHLGEC